MNFKDIRKSVEERCIFPFTDFLVFSNIWIALIAGVLFFAINVRINDVYEITNGNFLVVFATYFVYNFLRYRSLNHVDFAKSNLAKWMKMHLRFVQISMLLSVLIAAYLAFAMIVLNIELLIFFTLSFALLILYIAGGMRRYWQFKNPIISMVWLAMTVLLPLIEQNQSALNHLVIIAAHFFIFMALTTPFDIRDVKYDNSVDAIRTLPLKYGVTFTQNISICFVIVALILLAICDMRWFFYMLPAMIFLMMLLKKSTPHKSEYHYSLLLDGSLMVYAICIILFS